MHKITHIAGKRIAGYALVGGLALIGLSNTFAQSSSNNPYPDVIRAIRSSIVGIGMVSPTASPAFSLLATGFAVGDGRWIVTNAHTVPTALDHSKNEQLAIFQFQQAPGEPLPHLTARIAELRQVDRERDIALLQIQGAPIPALNLRHKNGFLPEGSLVLFSGFALGQNFGNALTTHRGMVAAISPSTRSIPRAEGLNAEAVRAMRNAPFMIYQLDATAFPGHSGSPMIDPETREVVGIISGGYVKRSRETAVQAAISQPTSITYAVPIQYVSELLQQAAK